MKLRVRRSLLVVLIGIVAVLVAARAYAPVALQRYVNRALDRAEGYEGRIGDVGFHGYIKPFFEDVDVLVVEEEVEDQGFLSTLWEAVVGGAAEVLEDQSEDRVATRIPITGSVASPDIGFLRTLGNVLRTAFIDAFVPALEHSGEGRRDEARDPRGARRGGS